MRLPTPPKVCAYFSIDREQGARMMEKHLKQLLCIKGVCNSEERRKLHEQLMRLYEMVRQLVETLTPATSIHLELQPQGAELGKGGNASSQRDWALRGVKEDLAPTCRRGQPSSLEILNLQ